MNRTEFEDYVDKYLSGQLDRDEIELIWIEMVQNPERLEYFKHVANTKGAVKELKEELERTKQSSLTARYVKYGVAAAIALLIGVLSIMQWNTSQQPAVKPIESIELDYYRSESGDIISSPGLVNKIISQAITMANSGDTEQAINMLKQKRTVIDSPSDRALISLNIGSLQYNAEQFEPAISNFKRVIDDGEHVDVLTLEKAYWFLGNSYFQMGKMAKAREAIREAYELDGAYRRVAGTYLNALAEKNR
jgi:tetratricopeptide (TPR) repeat protein